jgi:hypothetical protein
MMASHDRAFGVSIGTAAVTFFFVLACGSPREAQADPCADVDTSTPLEVLTRCAEQGDALAQVNLAVTYDLGRRVPRDREEAVRWYRMAAEQGQSDAQTSLGLRYRLGNGVPEDLVISYMWYDLSAAQGSGVAQRSRDVIEERLTPEQVAEAQRLSREWTETHPLDGGG